LGELELKSFWHKKLFVPKWIWLYLSQFLTVFDEPKTPLKVINVVIRANNARDRLTCLLMVLNIFEMRQPGYTKGCNNIVIVIYFLKDRLYTLIELYYR